MTTDWHKMHEDYLPATLSDGTAPIPLFGMRFVVCLGRDGQRLFACEIDNEEDMDPMLLAGYLTAVRTDVVTEYLNNGMERIKR